MRSAREVRSTVKKETSSMKTHRSASLDTRAARGSYIPVKKRPSSEDRKSGNKLFSTRWGNARKSSINLSEAKRKDARPLTDKAYQKLKVCQLAEFLEETGFNPPMSTTKLMSPSKKDFENIFQFLYKCFDPSYEVKKIEEEAPKILKNLGYPFSVNKSAFVYVARTNWPSLLGVLVWLMDLNKFAMKVDMKALFESPSDDERTHMQRILLRYICQCHHSGTDNEEEENAVFSEIVKSSMCQNLDELVSINEEKKLRLDSLNKEFEEMKQLTEHKRALERNNKKFEDYILKMKSHCQKKKELCEQLMEELKQKESILKDLEEEVSRKQDLYDAQGFDGKKHLQYFETQKKELAETVDKKRTLVNQVQNKFWESEIEYKNKSEKIIEGAESFRRLYNSIIDQTKEVLQPLQNIKISVNQVQKQCSNFHFDFPDWEISLDKYDAKSRKANRSALNEIEEKVKNTDEILKRICASLNQRLIEIEMKNSELSTQLKLLSIHENQKESDLDSKKKQTEEKISSLESQCEKVFQHIKTLRMEKSGLEKTYNEMSEELNSLWKFRERKEKELKEYLVDQEEMFKYFARYEERALKLSEEYGDEISEKLEELKKLKQI